MHSVGPYSLINDRTGFLSLDRTVIRDNIGGTWHILPGISMHADTAREITDSVLQ